ncbi:MAG: hypothetical protein KTR16_02685 [Acidiferrobacterales bacterium]|nr:hypothetical protein [Acidiferrobacterales bacterium]
MKLTETVIELMFELSVIEGEKHSEYLDGEGNALRNNLLKLFKKTDNPESHDIIIDIMSEAGYPWFGKLARSSTTETESVADLVAKSNSEDRIMSDDEFMDIIPINGHIH